LIDDQHGLADGRDDRRRWPIERELQDVLQAAHVEQLEGKCVRARLVETVWSVPFAESEQLLRLTQPRPGMRLGQELLRERTDCGADKTCLLNEPLRAAQRVGGALRRIVVRIGSSTALRLTRMDGDQYALRVQPHQLPIAAHLEACAGRAAIPGRRIQRRLETNVVVQVTLTVRQIGTSNGVPS